MENGSKKPRGLVAAVGIMLAAATLVAIAPSVAAHTCTWEEGTSSADHCQDACPDGEDHNHKVTHHHENGLGEDESHIHYSCSSSDGGGGICLPAICESGEGGGSGCAPNAEAESAMIILPGIALPVFEVIEPAAMEMEPEDPCPAT